MPLHLYVSKDMFSDVHLEMDFLLEYFEKVILMSLFVPQVPKPINYFLEVHLDEKGVKQIIRLMLSKFVRRQPGRSDNDWACMWRDLRQLQEKAFPFLDLEFMLTEFCRGLLKAGKFSLARNYLKGTGSVALPLEKAESLVINAAKEYFFSAPSLASEEVSGVSLSRVFLRSCIKLLFCPHIYATCHNIFSFANLQIISDMESKGVLEYIF